MKLEVKDTKLQGVKLLITDRFEDYRGEMGGIYDEQQYFDAGITTKFIYEQVSMNFKNVLRGMHYDKHTTKLMQCLYGTVYAVVACCDETSPDFGKWQGFILSDKNHHQLLVPPMYGNGHYTLTEKMVYLYKMSHPFSDEQFTLAWNDPKFNIRWPTDTPILSARDDII